MALAIGAVALLVGASDASAIRYASTTGTSANDCQTPATACDLTTAVEGKLGNEPKANEEVSVAPGTYEVKKNGSNSSPYRCWSAARRAPLDR